MKVFSRLRSLLREGWLMAGTALLGLCLLEGGLTLAFYIDDRLTWKPADTRFEADTYEGAPWAFDYYREHVAMSMHWEPYVYWRRSPYHGQLINVDEGGLRATTPSAPEPGALQVFMFGGSTMWGTGARDAFTIPSLVARELRAQGVVANIANFGESGYVSTQSLLTLQHELRQGHRPDLVVIYDGINDVYSAYQQRVAGWPQNEGNRFRDFNLSLGDRVRRVAKDLGTRSQTRRLLLHFTPGANASAVDLPVGAFSATRTETAPLDASLARQAIQTFAANVEVFKALGREYGFETEAFWQPTILDKPHLTAYEQAYRTEMTPMEPFFSQAYDLFRSGSVEGTREIHDLSRVFVETKIPVFVDYFHLGEKGDELVANAMVPELLRAIERHKAQPVTRVTSGGIQEPRGAPRAR